MLRWEWTNGDALEWRLSIHHTDRRIRSLPWLVVCLPYGIEADKGGLGSEVMSGWNPLP